jgi:hypothetical protein
MGYDAVAIRFGKPLVLSEPRQIDRDDALSAVTRRLEREVRALLRLAS